jgi:hypothetical protein
MKLDALKLQEKLDDKAEGYEKYHKIIKMLNTETVFEALTAIDDMQNAIGAKLQEREKITKLAELQLEILE